MRGLVRILAIAVSMALAAVAGFAVAAPAHASTDSIVRFALPTFLQGVEPSELVVHFDPVVDLGAGPAHAVGVTGTLTVTSGASAMTRTFSGDGATADVTIDVSQFGPGALAFSGSVSAAGAAVPYTFEGYQGVSLVTGDDGTTVAAGYAQAEAHRDLWGCTGIEYAGTRAVCVVETPRSGDETWQRGFRLAFHWEAFVSTPDPEATCTIAPMLPLRPDGTAREPTMMLRVPGDWSSYSIPMTADDLSGWTPGSSRMSWYLQCDDVFTPWVETGRQSASDLVPDLPPTEPTTVTASSAAGGDLAVSTGGSTVLGAAPLQGYDVSVVDGSGNAVAAQQVAAPSSPAAGAMRAMVARSAAHTFRGLAPGSYVVRVAAYNSVGASDPATSSVVRVSAAKPAPKPLSSVRTVKTKRAGTRATVSWTAPARTGNGIARYTVELRRGAHLIRSVRVTSAKHAVLLTGLVRHRAYRVVITAIARDGRAARIARTISG